MPNNANQKKTFSREREKLQPLSKEGQALKKVHQLCNEMKF